MGEGTPSAMLSVPAACCSPGRAHAPPNCTSMSFGDPPPSPEGVANWNPMVFLSRGDLGDPPWGLGPNLRSEGMDVGV